jgi:hypothetical protein
MILIRRTLLVLGFAMAASPLLAQGPPISGTAHVILNADKTTIASAAQVTFSLSVDLSAVHGQGSSGSTSAVLGGYQIAVTFDKTLLHFTGATGGTSSGFTATPTFTNPTTANANGSVTLVASQSDSSSPTGLVSVATLVFNSINAGSASTSAAATSLSTAFQPPSFGPTSIPSSGSNAVVTIVAPPAQPSSPTPANQATGVQTITTLAWGGAQGATSYTVYLGSTNPPPLLRSVGTNSAQVTLVAGTNYYWYVVAMNAGGQANGPVWTFKTAGTAPCAVPSAPVATAPSSSLSGASYEIQWQSVEQATGYRVEESSDASFTNPTVTTVTTTTFTATKSVTQDTTFYYRVIALFASGACNTESGPSTVVSVRVSAPAVNRRVIPVVGSTAGSFGSFFRTAVQLHNASSLTAHGSIVFHPLGKSATDSDPSVQYEIGPGQVIAYDDVVAAAGGSGIGSADLVTQDAVPDALIRVFNDGGGVGTTGCTEELMSSADALAEGDRVTLIGPTAPTQSRFNIGVRTLDAGATIELTATNAQGAAVTTVTRDYPPNYFEQRSDTDFLGTGGPLSPNYSLSITVKAGSLFVYGSTTDNKTQDPSLQMPRKP